MYPSIMYGMKAENVFIGIDYNAPLGLGYERVYQQLCKVADTFRSEGGGEYYVIMISYSVL